MIKFVNRTNKECGDIGNAFYVFDLNNFRAEYIFKPDGLRFFGNGELLFIVNDNPDYTAEMLGCSVYCMSENLKKTYVKFARKKNYEEDIERGVCVDPRVIMASVFVYLAAPSWDFIHILNEAMDPLPSYEVAEKWLWDNDFTTPKKNEFDPIGRVIEVGENPAHFVNIPPRIKKALLKIRELDPEWHDD